eukprot:ANDGO_08124.mRNA.1 Dynein gamma chain
MALDGRHKYVFGKAAELLGVSEADLVDFSKDTGAIDNVNSFFKAEGPPKLLIFNISDPSSLDTSGVHDRIDQVQLEHSKGFFMTVGEAPACVIGSPCIYFLRLSNKALAANSIDQDCVHGYFGKDMLGDLKTQLQTVLLPALKAQSNWGELTRDDGVTYDADIREFLESTERFLNNVREADLALHDIITLPPPSKNFQIKNTPEAMKAASLKLEVVVTYEETVRQWMSIISSLIAGSSLIRSEAEDSGPRAELEYWKSRMAKFNSVLEQLKAPQARVVFGVLRSAPSPVLVEWNKLDVAITNAANEAKDNVKYLYTLEEFYDPLYKLDPPNVIPTIPGLLNSIRMMYSIARFYNTAERMTALFVKVTNQIIVCCRKYLTTANNIFDEDRSAYVERLRSCVDLNDAYQRAYRETKLQLQSDPANRQFDFSESALFSNVDLFSERIVRIMDILHTISQFSTLEGCLIDGIQPLVKRFRQIVDDIKKKPQTFFLDHRKSDFDKYYLDFRRSVLDLESELVNFINEAFLKTSSTVRAISLLQQFKGVLQRESLQKLLEEKYLFVFEKYTSDLDMVKNQYEAQKEDPPVPRNTPKVAGSIFWSRQLLRRIERPMMFFLHTPVIQSKDGKRVVKLYNKIATALVSFETLWFDCWCQSVEAARDGLHATLLVRHPDTKALYVNFDTQIMQLLREARCLKRLGFDIPDTALIVCDQEERFKSYCEVLHHMVRVYSDCPKQISSGYKPLAQPLLQRLDDAIRPGLQSITWTSLNIDSYIANLKLEIEKFQEVVRKCEDIFKTRIEGGQAFIRNLRLIRIAPGESTMSVHYFLEKQTENIVSSTTDIDLRNQEIETATHDLVNFLHSVYLVPEAYEIEEDVKRFVRNQERQTFEAVALCIRHSVSFLKHRLTIPILPNGQRVVASADNAIFKADLTVLVPDVVLDPPLPDLQRVINTSMKMIIERMKFIYWWGQSRPTQTPLGNASPEKEVGSQAASDLRSIHVAMGSNRQVVKSYLQLTGAVEALKREVSEYIAMFARFNLLWNMNRADYVKAFMAKNPSLEDFESELKKFNNFKLEAERFQEFYVIGPITLDLSPLCATIKNESLAWKQAIGGILSERIKGDVQQLILYMDDTTQKLSRNVRDLEDINLIMSTLASLRETEAEIEMKLIPIEDTYALLNKYHVTIEQEEQDQVDVIRYTWKKLIVLARSTMDKMREIAPGFKKSLLDNVHSFAKDVDVFNKDFVENGPGVKGVKPRIAVDRVKTFQAQFDERERKMQAYQMGEQLFGLPVSEYPDLSRIGKELKLLAKLYDLYTDVLMTVNGYEEILWVDMNADAMGNQLLDFQNKCRKMPKQLRDWDAYEELKKMIDDMNETLPLLIGLAHPSMRDRHWDAVSELCGVKLEYQTPDFKIKTLLEANLLSHRDEIEEITSGAVKEADIEVKLGKVRDDWVSQDLQLGAFKNRGNLVLKSSETSELLALIEDTQMTLGSLLSNRYNRPFRKDIQLWIQKLTTVQEVLELFLQVQALWIYLEAVFSGGDIARQLPQEAKRFANIDKSWCKIMATAADNANVVKLCHGDDMLRNLLPHLFESLEICQKSLSGYLEAKRQVFPRFYFVSDAQLLEILGQGSDPHTIQPHLLSIFANLAKVQFDGVQRNKIVAMESAEAESVPLSTPLVCDGNIEDWLNKLVVVMADTVRDVSAQMFGRLDLIQDGGNRQKVEEFIAMFPAQVSLLGVQVFWTVDSEDALNKAKTEKNAMAVARKKFEALLATLIDVTTGNLSKRMRTNVETLITIHIHQVDIFLDLVKLRVRAANDFEWLKQTRFYWKPEEMRSIVSITDVDFDYCWEYLGCKERLVITPLTDRIYISCSQAMGMYYGGAPAGPAGTGKTETTKDMGSSVGKYFITINCSDQMDYRGMAKLYKGIAQSGIWCGFDEINRVELEVLSVVAAQIACIYAALRDRKTVFTFVDGTDIPLDPKCGIFITMNPGYAGRTELPENMKALFRSIAVVVPDRQIIMRVRLAASGFQENQALAKKFFILYRLCEEQLSKQTHYDFGLRNILSVLRTCGTTKRSNLTASETMVLMRVLRDMNISKLVEEDEPLFLSLIADLFPGTNVEASTYPELQQAIAKHADAMGLINSPGWNLKVIQFYEQWRVRHGLCLMGPSGAGKSSLLSVLLKSLSDVDVPTKEVRMNPKAITATQMFGRLDVQTNDWTDGIFSSLWRRSNKRTQGNSWIILDGPVDAVWIENLNTVLDDTRTLTLANGDRLGMPATLKLVFEVGNLDNASPATVSRMGMVYMGPSALGWEPVVEAWLKSSGRFEDEKAKLRDLFNKSVEGLLVELRDNFGPRMNVEPVNYLSTFLKLLAGLLPRAAPPQSNNPEDNKGPAIGAPRGPAKQCASHMHVERLFTFAACWSLGGLLELPGRRKFHDFMKKLGFDLPKIATSGGDGEDVVEETVFDYFVDDSGDWKHWSTRVPAWEYPRDPEKTPDFASILVPTVDNVRCGFLIQLIANQGLPVLLIGEPGTAKTVTIQQFLFSQDPDYVKNKMIAFSSATTPMIFQRTLEASVEKRMGTSYGPPPGKKLLVFIDDINMPEINEWGDQVTNEIVRQLVEDGGFFSLEKPGEWSSILDVHFLAAMNQPGGGRNDIPSRMKRHFSIFNVTLPSTVSVERIYGAMSAGHFCAERGFAAPVVEAAKLLPRFTRVLWEATKKKMLPTPAKFHYIFNLRDLSRTFQGILKSEHDVIKTKTDLFRLWRHECERVLPDRFNDPADLEWFGAATKQLIVKELGEEAAPAIMDTPIYFADFLREEVEPENPEDESYLPKIYEPIASFPQLQERLEYYQTQYNETYKKSPMDLVLFEYAMVHLLRISRVIRTARGNALLVGVGGSGKQSLTRLASFIAGYKTFQIVITKTYNITNLMDDLKALYRMAAVDSPVTFLFTDNEIKDESFLEYINMILTSGEISGLFPKDELDAALEDVRPIAKKEFPGFVDTSENLYKYFINRVRDRLHVVLCFSPVGDKFRTRARKFPGLISGCNIDWFPLWPLDALHATAKRFLGEFSMLVATDQVRSNLVDHICNVHDLVGQTTGQYFAKYRRNVFTTPKSYLSFIDSYKKVYKLKYEEVKVLADRINAGLSKLLQAEKDVSKMKIDLQVKEKDLAVAVTNTEKLLAVIKEQTAIAEKKKNEVQKVKDELQGQADQIKAEKEQAEAELEAARPALEEAESALNQIKPADIATLKKLGKPPNLIKRIMDGVLLLRMMSLDKVNVDPEFAAERSQILPSWGDAVKMMNDSNFLNALMSFERDAINDETCELLAPYLEMEDFTTDLARKSSGNAAGLCTWVRAMVTYHEVAKVVAPKRERLREAEVLLRAAQKELSAAQAELDEKQRQVDEMMTKLDAAMKEKQRLQDDATLTKSRLNAAEQLITGLAGEKIRWTQQSKEFDDKIRRLVGDVAIACAFLSYAGPFNSEFRTLLVAKRWKGDLDSRAIPRSSDEQMPSLTSFLTDENTIGEWTLQGLPTDDLSIQNGIIVTQASRYPLLVDPQGQAKKWIKSREDKNGLILTTLTHKMFRQHLEDALSQGRPMLIEDLGEDLDPVIDPLLEKQFIRVGARKKKVRVGDKEVDVEDGFVLYMTTKLPNPRYTPEIFAKTSIIDFTVTIKGLEDQLLGRVILKEKAELEESRKQLLEEINSCKKTVAKCEEDLLYRLSSSQGNLLDDASLIEVLNQTKKIAAEVTEKLSIAETTTEKITLAREEFRPVATRGSILYFVLTELSLVNVMYQISLELFLQLFDQAIDTADKSPFAAKRIENIISNSTFSIFKYVQRGLYEKDKLMYSLLLALKIDLVAGKISSVEFNTLLRGGAAVDMNTARKKPFAWIPDNSWLNLIALSSVSKFVQLLENIVANEAFWRGYYDAELPENSPLPEPFDGKLSQFQKFMLVRSWREDRAMMGAQQYIMESLGQQFVEGIPLDWELLWSESAPRIPVICLLSMGADPSSSIEALARKKKIDIKMVSMGQGQEVIARRLVANAVVNGGWVLLQNCHLGLRYLAELEEQLFAPGGWVSLAQGALQQGAEVSEKFECEPSFRIWITTEPNPRFPINLLQAAIKLTNEPPQGVKAGLRRSFAWVNQDMLDAVDKPQWRQMLYAATFLHSTVIERKKFGPLGWCVPYEFNQTDLAASVQFLQNHLYNLDPRTAKGPSWETVRYMVCEVQYGGRITDDYDKRLLVTYGDIWFSPQLFSEEFEFYKGYKVPNFKSIQEYRGYIDSLPLVDTPEIFGMHPNAELTFNANKSKDVLGTILDVQPKDSGGSGGETREEAVLRIASDLLSKLPPDYSKIQVKTQMKKIGGTTPLNVFLGQEIDRMQIVISAIRRTLLDLKLAIAGTIIMSADLQNALDALFDARVPAKWLRVSWPSPTLGFWFSDVLGRVRQYTSWLTEGRPKSFMLGYTFNPQGLLTALKQESTRKHQGWSLDNVVLKTEVLKEESPDQLKAAPDDGIVLHGLYLEGATWDRKNVKLIDSKPKELFTLLPLVHVIAVNVSPAIDSRTYVCPVYKIPRRTALNFVFDVTLRSDTNVEFWTLRGVACLLSRV